MEQKDGYFFAIFIEKQEKIFKQGKIQIHRAKPGQTMLFCI